MLCICGGSEELSLLALYCEAMLVGLSLLCSKFYLLFFPDFPHIILFYSSIIPIIMLILVL